MRPPQTSASKALDAIGLEPSCVEREERLRALVIALDARITELEDAQEEREFEKARKARVYALNRRYGDPEPKKLK